MQTFTGRVTLLAGGVGAARLLRGLTEVIKPESLTVIVNTGDDDLFYGLHVSPDLDTIAYTLAGLAPEGRGWGIRGDTFHALGALETYHGPGWFRLGDRDLATHIYRTEQLRAGVPLSEVTARILDSHGVRVRVIPATDDPLKTEIETGNGRLPFQRWLVGERARPVVRGVRYVGARRAKPAPGVIDAIAAADRVIVAPSNPFVSIGPVLAVPGVRAALRAARQRAVAVSPLIHGKAVKGPLVEMLRARGESPDAFAIRDIYSGLVSHLVVAPGDASSAPPADSPAAARRRGRAAPTLVEYDILIQKKAAAVKLARALCAATW